MLGATPDQEPSPECPEVVKGAAAAGTGSLSAHPDTAGHGGPSDLAASFQAELTPVLSAYQASTSLEGFIVGSQATRFFRFVAQLNEVSGDAVPAGLQDFAACWQQLIAGGRVHGKVVEQPFNERMFSALEDTVRMVLQAAFSETVLREPLQSSEDTLRRTEPVHPPIAAAEKSGTLRSALGLSEQGLGALIAAEGGNITALHARLRRDFGTAQVPRPNDIGGWTGFIVRLGREHDFIERMETAVREQGAIGQAAKSLGLKTTTSLHKTYGELRSVCGMEPKQLAVPSGAKKKRSAGWLLAALPESEGEILALLSARNNSVEGLYAALRERHQVQGLVPVQTKMGGWAGFLWGLGRRVSEQYIKSIEAAMQESGGKLGEAAGALSLEVVTLRRVYETLQKLCRHVPVKTLEGIEVVREFPKSGSMLAAAGAADPQEIIDLFESPEVGRRIPKLNQTLRKRSPDGVKPLTQITAGEFLVALGMGDWYQGQIEENVRDALGIARVAAQNLPIAQATLHTTYAELQEAAGQDPVRTVYQIPIPPGTLLPQICTKIGDGALKALPAMPRTESKPPLLQWMRGELGAVCDKPATEQVKELILTWLALDVKPGVVLEITALKSQLVPLFPFLKPSLISLAHPVWGCDLQGDFDVGLRAWESAQTKTPDDGDRGAAFGWSRKTAVRSFGGFLGHLQRFQERLEGKAPASPRSAEAPKQSIESQRGEARSQTVQPQPPPVKVLSIVRETAPPALADLDARLFRDVPQRASFAERQQDYRELKSGYEQIAQQSAADAALESPLQDETLLAAGWQNIAGGRTKAQDVPFSLSGLVSAAWCRGEAGRGRASFKTALAAGMRQQQEQNPAVEYHWVELGHAYHRDEKLRPVFYVAGLDSAVTQVRSIVRTIERQRNAFSRQEWIVSRDSPVEKWVRAAIRQSGYRTKDSGSLLSEVAAHRQQLIDRLLKLEETDWEAGDNELAVRVAAELEQRVHEARAAYGLGCCPDAGWAAKSYKADAHATARLLELPFLRQSDEIQSWVQLTTGIMDQGSLPSAEEALSMLQPLVQEKTLRHLLGYQVFVLIPLERMVWRLQNAPSETECRAAVGAAAGFLSFCQGITGQESPLSEAVPVLADPGPGVVSTAVDNGAAASDLPPGAVRVDALDLASATIEAGDSLADALCGFRELAAANTLTAELRTAVLGVIAEGMVRCEQITGSRGSETGSELDQVVPSVLEAIQRYAEIAHDAQENSGADLAAEEEVADAASGFATYVVDEGGQFWSEHHHHAQLSEVSGDIVGFLIGDALQARAYWAEALGQLAQLEVADGSWATAIQEKIGAADSGLCSGHLAELRALPWNAEAGEHRGQLIAAAVELLGSQTESSPPQQELAHQAKLLEFGMQIDSGLVFEVVGTETYIETLRAAGERVSGLANDEACTASLQAGVTWIANLFREHRGNWVLETVRNEVYDGQLGDRGAYDQRAGAAYEEVLGLVAAGQIPQEQAGTLAAEFTALGVEFDNVAALVPEAKKADGLFSTADNTTLKGKPMKRLYGAAKAFLAALKGVDPQGRERNHSRIGATLQAFQEVVRKIPKNLEADPKLLKAAVIEQAIALGKEVAARVGVDPNGFDRPDSEREAP